MKKNVINTLFFAVLIFTSFNVFSQSAIFGPNHKAPKNINKKASLNWNYSGSINKYPIKAFLKYGEGINSRGSGALQIPISGYYYYESQNKKIQIQGSCSGVGMIYFVAHTSDGDEIFDGEFTGSMLGDFKGTWDKNGKSLNFNLKSKR
jgi:hypothetical protein